MKYADKTVMTVMLENDYGDPKRGTSGEKKWFYENLKKLVGRVEPVWFDPYIADSGPLQNVLKEAAARIKPDLILFAPYTWQFETSTLDELKSKYRTAVWFGDDHWRFDSFSKILGPHFTHVITTDPLCVSKYRQLGIEPILSDWAGEPPTEILDPTLGVDYKYDVSFVGGRNDVRSWVIGELAKSGIRVECFGSGWPNGRLSFEEMDRVFFQSRINLNLSNSVPQDVRFVFSKPIHFLRWLRSPKQTEQVKARNFEIPLAGGFQLSKYAVGLERHWKIGEEIAVFDTPAECAAQIHYYLFREEERRAMTARAFKRAHSEHTFAIRFAKILESIF